MSVTFGTVFQRLQRRVGKDPAITMSTPLPARYADALSEALRVGYEAAFWPRVMLVEERTPTTHADGYRIVEFAQAGKTEIGAVEIERCLYLEDPRVTTGQQPEDGVSLSPTGIILPDDVTDATVFIRYMPAPTTYASTDTSVAFPEFMARFAVLAAASELLEDDQARFRTRAAADEELERLLAVEFEGSGMDSRAIR